MGLPHSTPTYGVRVQDLSTCRFHQTAQLESRRDCYRLATARATVGIVRRDVAPRQHIVYPDRLSGTSLNDFTFKPPGFFFPEIQICGGRSLRENP